MNKRTVESAVWGMDWHLVHILSVLFIHGIQPSCISIVQGLALNTVAPRKQGKHPETPENSIELINVAYLCGYLEGK